MRSCAGRPLCVPGGKVIHEETAALRDTPCRFVRVIRAGLHVAECGAAPTAGDVGPIESELGSMPCPHSRHGASTPAFPGRCAHPLSRPKAGCVGTARGSEPHVPQRSRAPRATPDFVGLLMRATPPPC